jgi:hypothetical protein
MDFQPTFDGKKEAGSLASEFQFLRDCLQFIHQTRMYCAKFYPMNSGNGNPCKYGQENTDGVRGDAGSDWKPMLSNPHKENDAREDG